MSIRICSDKNKGTEHIDHISRLVCAFVFRSFSHRDQYNTFVHELRHETIYCAVFG